MCKACTMRYIVGVSVNTTAGGFRIWCFDAGAFKNEVPCKLSKLLSASYDPDQLLILAPQISTADLLESA